MKETGRRIVGYGTGLTVAGALVYLGVVVAGNTKADVDTLLGSAEVQLRLASSMPKEGKGGKVNLARARLVGEISKLLDDAEARRPDSMPARELRAHLHYLEGNYQKAADLYGKLGRCQECTADQRDTFVLNQARMLRAAGEPREAARALSAHDGSFLAKNSAKSQIEKANVFLELGQRRDAVELINRLVASTEDPMVLMQAGAFLERRNELASASHAFEKATPKRPLAGYYRARLKVKAREYDTALDLLERAIGAAGRRVRVLLKQDRETWKPFAQSSRFCDLLEEPVNKSAQPGR